MQTLYNIYHFFRHYSPGIQCQCVCACTSHCSTTSSTFQSATQDITSFPSTKPYILSSYNKKTNLKKNNKKTFHSNYLLYNIIKCFIYATCFLSIMIACRCNASHELVVAHVFLAAAAATQQAARQHLHLECQSSVLIITRAFCHFSPYSLR